MVRKACAACWLLLSALSATSGFNCDDPPTSCTEYLNLYNPSATHCSMQLVCGCKGGTFRGWSSEDTLQRGWTQNKVQFPLLQNPVGLVDATDAGDFGTSLPFSAQTQLAENMTLEAEFPPWKYSGARILQNITLGMGSLCETGLRMQVEVFASDLETPTEFEKLMTLSTKAALPTNQLVLSFFFDQDRALSLHTLRFDFHRAATSDPLEITELDVFLEGNRLAEVVQSRPFLIVFATTLCVVFILCVVCCLRRWAAVAKQPLSSLKSRRGREVLMHRVRGAFDKIHNRRKKPWEKTETHQLVGQYEYDDGLDDDDVEILGLGPEDD